MYQICQHKNGDLLLVIEPQMSDPEDPMFIFDGGDTALLFRNWDSNLRLNNLSEQTRSALQNADEILVIEKQDECVIRTYIASIRFVRNVKSLIA
ncbi:MAG: hypothetical protein J6W38_00490 [Prevotella sp.]|nr:hypothetical protein [Prevotella sp.]